MNNRVLYWNKCFTGLVLLVMLVSMLGCNLPLMKPDSPRPPGSTPPPREEPRPPLEPTPPREEPRPPLEPTPPQEEPRPPLEPTPPHEEPRPPLEPTPPHEPGPEGPVADLAVTDIYPDNLPFGTLFVRITNNGPATLMTYPVILICGAHGRQWANQSPPDVHDMHQEYVIQLAPGETEAVATNIQIDANLFQYEVTCEVVADIDPEPGNNIYTEMIPVQ